MVINKKASKIYNFFVLQVIFFIKICWYSFCFFVVWFSFPVYNFIKVNPFHATDLFWYPWKHQKTRGSWCFQGVSKEISGMKWVNHWIINNTCWIFTFFATTCRRIPNIIFFTYMMFFHSHRHLSFFHFWFELHFFPWNL